MRGLSGKSVVVTGGTSGIGGGEGGDEPTLADEVHGHCQSPLPRKGVSHCIRRRAAPAFDGQPGPGEAAFGRPPVGPRQPCQDVGADVRAAVEHGVPGPDSSAFRVAVDFPFLLREKPTFSSTDRVAAQIRRFSFLLSGSSIKLYIREGVYIL